MLLSMATTDVPSVGDRVAVPFAKVFDPPRSRAEVMVNRRDGPAFAQLATDLTLDHPEGFDDYLAGSSPEKELAYRASRPLLSWLTALASVGGRRELLAPALMVLTVASLGCAAAATAVLASRSGRDPRFAWLVVLLPGMAVGLAAPGGCEPLAVALCLAGWIGWTFDGRTAVPIVLWSLAALTRETSLIVPLALAVSTPGGLGRRAAGVLAPTSTYGVWALVVAWRTGHLPGNAGGERTSLFFRGIMEGTPDWGPAEAVAIALVIATAVLAWRLRIRGVRHVLVAHVVLASGLGPLVWEQAADFTRVLILVQVVGLLALLPRTQGADTCQEPTPSSVR